MALVEGTGIFATSTRPTVNGTRVPEVGSVTPVVTAWRVRGTAAILMLSVTVALSAMFTFGTRDAIADPAGFNGTRAGRCPCNGVAALVVGNAPNTGADHQDLYVADRSVGAESVTTPVIRPLDCANAGSVAVKERAAALASNPALFTTRRSNVAPNRATRPVA